jgi:CMP-N-acetylneuraminic acid synthetase
MKKLVAVVPIRKGSQRVKNKNFRKFGDKNLLIHKINLLKQLNKIDEIVINTDSDEAISIAKKLGVKFFKRKDYFASSECINSDFWQNIAENTDSEYIMFTNCTSPLVELSTYQKIISIFENFSKNSFDSINTVSEIKEFLFKNNKPINFEINETPNSQDLPEIVKLNFAVSNLSTKKMYQKKSLLGDNPFLFKLDEIEGFDINSEFEFSFAEFLFKKING